MPTKFVRDDPRDHAKGFRWNLRESARGDQQRSSPMMLLFLGIAFFAFLLLVSQFLLQAFSGDDAAQIAEGRVVGYADGPEHLELEIEITDWPGPESMEGTRFHVEVDQLTGETLDEGALVRVRYRYSSGGEAVEILEVFHKPLDPPVAPSNRPSLE